MWGKDVAIIALLLIDKWVKGFSYKFPKISERNQLRAGKNQEQFTTKIKFMSGIFLHLQLRLELPGVFQE